MKLAFLLREIQVWGTVTHKYTEVPQIKNADQTQL
jgi:hypothetical protein